MAFISQWRINDLSSSIQGGRLDQQTAEPDRRGSGKHNEENKNGELHYLGRRFGLRRRQGSHRAKVRLKDTPEPDRMLPVGFIIRGGWALSSEEVPNAFARQFASFKEINEFGILQDLVLHLSEFPSRSGEGPAKRDSTFL
jgi:hypothetical protein